MCLHLSSPALWNIYEYGLGVVACDEISFHEQVMTPVQAGENKVSVSYKLIKAVMKTQGTLSDDHWRSLLSADSLCWKNVRMNCICK